MKYLILTKLEKFGKNFEICNFKETVQIDEIETNRFLV